MAITIMTYPGTDVAPWIDAVARLRIQVFREFPYLYDGDLDYERRYLATYAHSANSLFVLALDTEDTDNAGVVGASTAIALTDAEPEFRAPFISKGIPVEPVLYFGESVLQHQYRGLGLGHRFFDEREAFARKQNKTITSFCAVERPDDHPLRPANYMPLDSFWHRRGYRQHTDMKTLYNWRDIDTHTASDKSMVFWLHDWKYS